MPAVVHGGGQLVNGGVVPYVFPVFPEQPLRVGSIGKLDITFLGEARQNCFYIREICNFREKGQKHPHYMRHTII
jgi:hypothetical protein